MNLDKLISNEGWDAAILYISEQQPLPIDNQTCKVSIVEDYLCVSLSTGPYPFDKEKTCCSEHHVPLNKIQGISYYSEPKIISKPSIVRPL